MKRVQKWFAVVMIAVFMPFTAMADPPAPDPKSIFEAWKPPNVDQPSWKGRFGYAQRTFDNIQKFYRDEASKLNAKNLRCIWAKILHAQASMYVDLVSGKNGAIPAKIKAKEDLRYAAERLRDSCDKDDPGFQLYEKYMKRIGQTTGKWDLVRKVAGDPDKLKPQELKPEGKLLLERAQNDDPEAAEKLYMMFMLGVFVGCAEAGPLGCVLP